MAVWNAAFIISGLLLIALAGEVYLRLANPFLETSIPYRFVDGVGLIRKPNAELRYTTWEDDTWVVSRTNSLGFVDREPVSAERAAAGCHIAFIGDSFVEAIQTPIADKFHVRLEEMAAYELPHLDITTQAYGIGNTSQIHQLPFYDEYARRLNPKLVVLVFYVNDFANNSPALYALLTGVDPDRMPYMSAQKDEHGNMTLRPPDPEYRRFRLPISPKAWHKNAIERLVEVSYFAKWLEGKGVYGRWGIRRGNPDRPAWADMIAERPCCELLDIATYRKTSVRDTHLSSIYEEALEYTAFGIEQFKRRADQDGARLAILSATGDMGTRGAPQFDRLSAIAEPRGIPIISDYDYNIRQGHDAWWEGTFVLDSHWNATGHQWVAEAVLEWLKANQDVCD